MICAHEPTMDPRILWTAEYASAEFDVRVLGFNREDQAKPPEQQVDGYRIIRLQRIDERAAYFFWRLKDLLPRSTFIAMVVAGAALAPALVLLEIVARLLIGSARASRRALVAMQRSGSRLLTIRLMSAAIGRMLPRSRTRFTPRSSPMPDPARELRRLRTRIYYIVGLLRMQFSPAASGFWNYIRASEPKPQVIHCNDLDTLLVGTLAKAQFGCRLVYDAHEYFPYCDPNGRWLDEWFFSALEGFLINRCDGVVTVNPLLAELMQKAYRLRTVYAVPNAAPLADSLQCAPFSSPMSRLAEGRLKFLFQGRFTPGRGIEELIRAWALVDSSKAALFLRGPANLWREAEMDLARQVGVLDRSVYFLDSVSEEFLIPAAAEADVGIIPYLPRILNDRFACPNKLSQYMQAGLMVVTNNLPYVRSVVEEAQAGLVYQSSDLSTLASIVERVLADPALLHSYRNNALTFAREAFHWQVFAGTFHNLYRGAEVKQSGAIT
jgi:glycosyltransferase involved in cell wall biosynthesis